METKNKHLTTKRRAWWLVALMAASYGIGELSHFVLGSTTRHMSRELQYGDQSCMFNGTDSRTIVCVEYKNESTCNAASNGSNFCEWNYNGQGIVYQVLAGPSFIFTQTIGCLVIGALADHYNRVNLLATATVLFSLLTILMGVAQDVWQLVVLRMGIAFGEAACQVIPVSLVPIILPKSLHGTALGIVNWGIYFGYGLSYVVGNYVPALDILGQSWRWCYFLSGMPGLLVGLLLLLTADPKERTPIAIEHQLMIVEKQPVKISIVSSDPKSNSSALFKVWMKIRHFFHPAMISLLLGACVRHSAGFTLAYNTQLFFDSYYPGFDIGMWLFCDSIIGGTIGIVMGGVVSDKIVKKMGLQARSWVLAGSQLLATPFAVGVLLAPPPYSFLCLLSAYLFAETWFSVLFAILVELLPADTRSFSVAVFLFIMNNVGGNLPVLVEPLGELMDLPNILLILYPGFYFLSSVIFAVSGITLQKSQPTHVNSN